MMMTQKGQSEQTDMQALGKEISFSDPGPEDQYSVGNVDGPSCYSGSCTENKNNVAARALISSESLDHAMPDTSHPWAFCESVNS